MPLLSLLFLLLMTCLVTQCCNDRYSDYCDMAEEHLVDAVAEDRLVEDAEAVNRTRRSSGEPFRRTERQMSAQISSILDKLFNNGYDRRLRPQLDQQPLVVTINLVIRSMGPVDEQKQTFSLDCYFRQYWRDSRLRYNSTRLKELPMNWQFLYKIWRPDTYIVNGKQSYLHKMTVPNRFIRIAPDGVISYSQRLTVKARCQMDLRKFPLDSQRCPLEIGSFGHESKDVVYKWHESPLSMDKLGLAQYHLVDWSRDEFVGMRALKNISTVRLSFDFERQQGFFLLQIYIPLTLIVMCSWVTFWLAKTEKGSEIPARTSLGASSVLSIVTIGFGGKSKPQVAYATALDVFIVLCFIIVFASLVEYAIINFLDTLVRRLKRKDNDNKLVLLMAQHAVMGKRMPRIPAQRQESVMDTDGIAADDDVVTPPESSSPAVKSVNVFRFNGIKHKSSSAIEESDDELVEDNKVMASLADSAISFCSRFRCCRSVRDMEVYKKPHVVFCKVDEYSRKLFPLTFLVLNVFYWAGYMYLF